MCPNRDHEPAEAGSSRDPPRDGAPKAAPSGPGVKAGPSEAGAARTTAGEAARAKPLLASEALKDDLAPVEPLASAARYWSAVSGAAFIALGLWPVAAAGAGAAPEPSASAHYALGALVLAVSILPLRYAWRAALMVAAALACGLLGVTGRGPAATLAVAAGEWGLLHVLASVSLPAALFFRARYRAFAGARFILAAALVLTLPHAVYAALAVVGSPSLLVQLTSGAAVLVVLLSLLGFMGSESTGGGNIMAVGQIVAVTAQVASMALDRIGIARQPAATVGALVSVAAFAAAAVIGSLGLFQLFAWRLGPEARSVDTLERLPAERPRKHSVVDWLTRR